MPVLLMLFFASCGSTSTIAPPKLDEQLTIDGSLADWNTSETLYSAELDANYYATHDENHLYLFIEFKSPFKDRAVRQSGFIIYLSNSEDLRKQTGIGYPSGSFNLLRENPAMFDDFLRETDWITKPNNSETLDRLEGEIFDRVMIVERPDGKSNPEFGFVEPSQIEVDGLEIAADTQSRYISIEMKVPRDGSSIFNFSGNTAWLGFAIETPPFRFNNDTEYSPSANQQRGMYGGSRQPRPNRQNIARRLGEFEQWYKLDLR